MQEAEYKKQGAELLAAAWSTLNSPDWKLEKQLANGDKVEVKQVGGKKVFKLTVRPADSSCCQCGLMVGWSRLAVKLLVDPIVKWLNNTVETNLNL